MFLLPRVGAKYRRQERGTFVHMGRSFFHRCELQRGGFVKGPWVNNFVWPHGRKGRIGGCIEAKVGRGRMSSKIFETALGKRKKTSALSA